METEYSERLFGGRLLQRLSTHPDREPASKPNLVELLRLRLNSFNAQQLLPSSSKVFLNLIEASPNNANVSNRLPMTMYSMFPCRRDSLEVVGKSTITGRNQLTLPKHVREFLKAENGDLVVFLKDHDKILVKRGTVKIEEA